MTALTMPARPGEDDTRLRPVPWRRMAGVVWRQHRIALAGAAVLLGAAAVWLWITGTPLHHAYAAAAACHPASSPACQSLISTFDVSATSDLMGNKDPGGVLLQLMPALIGAFVGAPVLARELETGTFRYAWTQGFGRWRWASWCCSRSCWPPRPACSASWCPGISSRSPAAFSRPLRSVPCSACAR